MVILNKVQNIFEVLEKSHTIPTVILLDISMPKMNGWGVLDSLKRNPQWKYIPIIFISGEKDNLAKNFGKIFGNDFIEKPFEIKNLKVRIERVLER